jgi:hypothetical protein
MADPTPRPWKLSADGTLIWQGYHDIFGSKVFHVAVTKWGSRGWLRRWWDRVAHGWVQPDYEETARANAALIVKAVNHHDRLVAALVALHKASMPGYGRRSAVIQARAEAERVLDALAAADAGEG